MCGWTAGLLAWDPTAWAGFVRRKSGLLRWSVRNEIGGLAPGLPAPSRALLVEAAEALAWERFVLERGSLARHAEDLDGRLVLLGRWSTRTVLEGSGAERHAPLEEDCTAPGASSQHLAEIHEVLGKVAGAVSRALARMAPRPRRILEGRFGERASLVTIAGREGCGTPRISRLLGRPCARAG